MSRFKKRLLIVVILVSVACSLILLLKKDQGVSDVLKVLSYPYDVLSRALSSTSDKFSGLLNAAEENRRFKEEIQALQVEKLRYSELSSESKRLHELLNLKQQISSNGIAAHVIGRGYDKFANTRVIDKGKQQGINKDEPVMTPKGLAGKVLNVRRDFADIILLTDSNFSAAVRLAESRNEGVLSGTGRWSCLLKYVPVEVAVKEGEIVVTSGLDGIFPPGIPVGRVTKVQTEGVEFFQYIEVTPFQSSSTIEEVLIVSRTTDMKTMLLQQTGQAAAE